MSLGAALAGGLVGTTLLTVILRAATELRLTRIDLPFLLGTAVTANRSRAKALGYALHFLFGAAFSVLYWVCFSALGHAGWALGALFGGLHGTFAGTSLVNVLLPAVHPRMGTPTTSPADRALLEPPGFMLLNYGPRTPIATLLAHLVYGAVIGAFVAAGS